MHVSMPIAPVEVTIAQGKGKTEKMKVRGTSLLMYLGLGEAMVQLAPVKNAETEVRPQALRARGAARQPG